MNPYFKSEELIKRYGLIDAIKNAEFLVMLADGTTQRQFWSEVLNKLKSNVKKT